MTRISYRGLIGLALVLPFFTLSNVFEARTSADEKSNVAEKEASSKLIGTWQLEKAENPGSPSGIGTRLKMFNGTHWCVIQPDEAGKIVFLHGGTYEFDGTDLKAKTDFAGELTESFIGTKGTVKLRIDGDTLLQIDPNGVFNETWQRVKNPNASLATDPIKLDHEAIEKKLTGDWYVREINAPKGKRRKDSVYNVWSLFQSPPTRLNWPKDTGVFTDNENESVQTYGKLVLNGDVDPMWLDFRFRDMDMEYVQVGIVQLDRDGDPHWVLNREWIPITVWEKTKGKVSERPKAFKNEKKQAVGFRLER